jgi:hypothetical protein
MSEHDEVVERQRLILEAETWAKGVKTLHAHSLSSCWYDTRGNDGSVLDTEYNDGVIKREIRSTGEIVYFGESLSGQELLNSYSRNTGK